MTDRTQGITPARRRRMAVAVAVAVAVTMAAAGDSYARGGLLGFRRGGVAPRAGVPGWKERAALRPERPTDGRYVQNDGQPSPHRKARPDVVGGSPLPDPRGPVPTLPGG